MGAAKEETLALLSMLRLHFQGLSTSIPVRQIPSKGFADETLQPRAQGLLYMYQVWNKKPEAIKKKKKKTNAKMSWTFEDDMF